MARHARTGRPVEYCFELTGERDRDGDIIDPAGITIAPGGLRFSGVRSPPRAATSGGTVRIGNVSMAVTSWNVEPPPVLQGASIGFDPDATNPLIFWNHDPDKPLPTPPPEHPDLLSLIADLQDVPPLEFVRWREESGIVADWLEEHGDDRGAKLRAEMAGVEVGQLYVRLIRLGGLLIQASDSLNGHDLTTDNWREMLFWILEECRYMVLEQAGLGHCTPNPHVGPYGGFRVLPWLSSYENIAEAQRP